MNLKYVIICSVGFLARYMKFAPTKISHCIVSVELEDNLCVCTPGPFITMANSMLYPAQILKGVVVKRSKHFSDEHFSTLLLKGKFLYHLYV